MRIDSATTCPTVRVSGGSAAGRGCPACGYESLAIAAEPSLAPPPFDSRITVPGTFSTSGVRHLLEEVVRLLGAGPWPKAQRARFGVGHFLPEVCRVPRRGLAAL